MVAAIYSRKSIFTGKGESIENQITLCKDYAEKHLKIDEFIIYEDEGYSGSNVNRPRFKTFINDVKNKKINVLICYRLDRISRNVADFSSTLELLQANNVDFISIKEQFDTTTPMGRAMVYISSVFAQLERETIAERVRDNMLQLAKTGRWLGGQEPYGYSAERLNYFDEDLKEKSLMKLTPIDSELVTVKLVFNKYLECHSINQVVKYLNQSNIRGKNQGDFATMQIRRLLSNPLYVKSSTEIEKYLRSLEINVYGEPNGNGYLTYNKTKNIKKNRATNEWIAAVGKHPGIIDTPIWLEVQNLLLRNKLNPIHRLGTGNTESLLTGILHCFKCNSNMIVKQGHLSQSVENLRYDYYVCASKENYNGKKCDNKNVRVDILDKLVMDKLHAYNKDLLIHELTDVIGNEVDENNLETIKDKILRTDNSINNLVKQLSVNTNEDISKYIFSEIEMLNNKIIALKSKLLENHSKDSILKSDFLNIYTIGLKRALLKTIISKVVWDGENKTVYIYF